MIYFTFKNFDSKNINFYNFLRDYFTFNKDYLLTPVTFTGVSGSFPYSYHNGNLNNNYGKGVIYKDLIQYQESSTYPFRFDCSNIYLTEEDFDDTFLNLYLKIFEIGSNYIEISNLDFLEYLKNKYPNYKYILSNNANFLTPFTPEILNKFTELDIFDLIQLNFSQAKNINFLKLLKNKNKYELPIGQLCNNCPKSANCLKLEQQTQYNFSDNFTRINCSLRTGLNKDTNILSLETIKKQYLPLGFNHFILPDFIQSFKDDIYIFIANYFIKQEYQANFFKDLEVLRV